MKTKCDISVAIVTYRRPSLVLNLVNNLLMQSVLPDTIFIIDNDIETDTLKNELSLSCVDSNVNIIYTQNSQNSLTNGRNLATSMNKSDLLCLLDDDVSVEGDYLEKVADTFHKYPDVIGVQGQIQYRNENPIRNLVQKFILGFNLNKNSKAVVYPSIQGSYPIVTSNKELIKCQWLSGSNQTYRN